MKFKISKIYLTDRALPAPKNIGLKGRRKLRAYRSNYYKTTVVRGSDIGREEIKIASLFEFAELESPKPTKKRPLRIFAKKVRGFFAAFMSAIIKLFSALGRATLLVLKKLVPLSRPRSIPMLCGALCAAVSVTAVSALLIAASLLARYFLPYEEFVIPDLKGSRFDDVQKIYSNDVSFSVTYDYSEKHEKGTVISQYPWGGVIKKQYASSPLSNISIKVSLGAKEYRIEDLVGVSERDALIVLRKNEIVIRTITEYSDTVEAGKIISTSPVAHSTLKAGDTVTLTVSLGKQINSVSVPDLYGLTESGAYEVITECGLIVGSISYEASSLPAGRVIAQSPAPFETLEEGESVSFTVSAGEQFSSHNIPDLYGLTVDQARQKLREAGLVIGTVYTVSSGAPSGTVIAQSPIPSMPITSSITSVDLYISS